MITVIGLGPAGPELITQGALAAAQAADHLVLRTARHPAARIFADARTCDDLYDAAESIDEVYPAIVDRLRTLDGHVVYAVPGSPTVAERSVELLRAACEVEILPALSFLDLAFSRVGVDPFSAGPRLVDGHRFAAESAGERGPLLVAQCDSVRVLSDIKLAADDPPEAAVVLQRLGLPDESVRRIAWADLDREVVPDPLTSLWIAELGQPVAVEMARFAELVRTLREGCPWDREQTHRSLTRHLIEESHEVLDAIAGLPDGAGEWGATAPVEIGDPAYGHLMEELGDLLFQVYFHATLAAESGHFTLADVARGVHDKLRARHPHVFDDAAETTTSAELSEQWEARKLDEKGRESVMDGIPLSLPSLALAYKVQRKAEAAGVPGPAPLEAATEDEVVDTLWAAVSGARALGVDPEAALRARAIALRDQVRAAGK